MKINAYIINYNTSKFLYKCLDSFLSQSIKTDIYVIDNNSKDNIKEIYEKYNDKVGFHFFPENKGYAYAANFACIDALKKESDYLLIANSDIILENEYIEKCIKKIEKKENFIGATGKLLRFDKKTIDSCGQGKSIFLKPFEYGWNRDAAGYDFFEQEVLGCCGALYLLKTNPLEGFIKKYGYCFDISYFCFYEDFDFNLRLQKNNLKTLFIPEATAYHFRSATIKQKNNKFLFFQRDDFIKEKIILNRYKTIKKNFSKKEFLLHLPLCLFYDLFLISGFLSSKKMFVFFKEYFKLIKYILFKK